MIDMRDYKGVIRETVRRERNCDELWTWKVRAINKKEAKIGWGYLDYLDGNRPKDNFIVIAEENALIGTVVTGTVPNGHKVIWFVGEKQWDNCKTIEEGISGVIHSMAQYAHYRY